MTDVTAETAKNTGQNKGARPLSRENATQKSELDRCYRQIGISAVAAAARYQGSAKNPAYAPAPVKWRDIEDAAA